MSYIVHHENGQKFGPVDLPTLNAWIIEGRVGPDTMIEDTETGITVPAKAINGIELKTDGSAPTVEGSAPYYRGGGYPSQPNSGQGELIAAWVLGAVTIVSCCPVLPAIGLYFANKAKQLGGSTADAARIFNIIMLVLSILGILLYVASLVFMFSLPMIMKHH
jgi:hypothetical protein